MGNKIRFEGKEEQGKETSAKAIDLPAPIKAKIPEEQGGNDSDEPGRVKPAQKFFNRGEKGGQFYRVARSMLRQASC